MTTATTEQKRPRGKRLRPDRGEGSRRQRIPDDEYAAMTERVDRLALEAARAAEAPGARAAYSDRVRARLLEEVDRAGRLDSGAVALAYSRTAVALCQRTGLHPLDAQAVRLQVLAEERERLGVEAVRGAPEVGTDLVGAADEISVPRGHALDGERPRRGGKR